MTRDSFSSAVTCVKGLAISLVVLGHINTPFSALIFSFHLPLFFFLGGIFVKTTDLPADFLKKNIIRLIVPFFIFGALGLIVNDIKNILLHRPLESIWQSIVGLLFWMDVTHMQHYGFVLWFLPALFWARIFTYYLLKINHFNEFLIVVLCVVLAYLFSSKLSGVVLPFCIDKGFVALTWVFGGGLFFHYKEKFLNLPIWRIVPIALIAPLIAYFYRLPSVDMAINNVDHVVVTLLYTCSVIATVVYFTYNIGLLGLESFRGIYSIIPKLGNNSMLVFVIHPYTNNVAFLSSARLFGDGCWYMTFVMTLVMLLLIVKFRDFRCCSFVFKYL